MFSKPSAVTRPRRDALVAEPVDERDRREQRRREQRDQRDRAEHALGRDAAARQRVGEAERERHGDERHQRRDPDAVDERLQQRRRRQVAREVGQADERALADPAAPWRGSSPAAAPGRRRARATISEQQARGRCGRSSARAGAARAPRTNGKDGGHVAPDVAPRRSASARAGACSGSRLPTSSPCSARKLSER